MEKLTEQGSGDAPGTIRERRAYWSGHVRQWRSSGLRQKEYCIREGISIERFGSWKRRLDREETEEVGSLVAVPSGVVSAALHAGRPTIKVVVNERYGVEIPEGFSPVTLKEVLHIIDCL